MLYITSTVVILEVIFLYHVQITIVRGIATRHPTGWDDPTCIPEVGVAAEEDVHALTKQSSWVWMLLANKASSRSIALEFHLSVQTRMEEACSRSAVGSTVSQYLADPKYCSS